ncbi:MAG: hypothetical protein LAT80_13835 [Balneolaceae bacterium]|nr:hypothetical protein [Balneolaceae bacterium]
MNINNQINHLYSIAFIFLAGVIFLFESRSTSTAEFEEITVERINIVENDGTIRLVISNKERQHPGRMDGEDLPDRERQAGLLFFNDKGDEAGGLLFGLQEEGGHKISSLSFTMDQYKNDQVVQVLNQDLIQGDRVIPTRGFAVNQFPDGARLMDYLEAMDEAQTIEDPNEMQNRMMEIQQAMGSRPAAFMGMASDGSGLFIFNDEGQPKLMLYVDRDGKPRIQTMDQEMNIIDLIEF